MISVGDTVICSTALGCEKIMSLNCSLSIQCSQKLSTYAGFRTGCERKSARNWTNSVLDLDIIEEVQNGPSGWISPLVVVPNSDGDVKVCVYLCRANEAIIQNVTRF